MARSDQERINFIYMYFYGRKINQIGSGPEFKNALRSYSEVLLYQRVICQNVSWLKTLCLM